MGAQPPQKTRIYYSGNTGSLVTRLCPETLGLSVMLSYYELTAKTEGKFAGLRRHTTKCERIRLQRMVRSRT